MGAGIACACAPGPQFHSGENLNFRSIDEVRHIHGWGGELMAYPVGPANPWILVAQLSYALLIAYLLMGCVTAWRHGDPAQRRSALIVCGGWPLFVAIMVSFDVLADAQRGQASLPGSPGFLLVIAAISYQLGAELLRSNQLADQPRESPHHALRDERGLARAARAADLERWTWDVSRNDDTGMTRDGDRPGADADAGVALESLRERAHPDDRGAVNLAQAKALEGGWFGSQLREGRAGTGTALAIGAWTSRVRRRILAAQEAAASRRT